MQVFASISGECLAVSAALLALALVIFASGPARTIFAPTFFSFAASEAFAIAAFADALTVSTSAYVRA